jgi:alpha-beta hydrolase superfamily lysophospholipase
LKPAIEAREVITLDSDGLCLRGTYHRPPDEKPVCSPASNEEGRMGILFVTLVLPRAANADAAVYWADLLARYGYHTFRCDLPGMGDSDGDLTKVDLQTRVDSGACGPVVCDIVNQLAERFNLGGMVVVGNCSGAVTALFASAGSPRIRGLILLDPYFFVQQENEIERKLVSWQSRIIKKLVGNRPTQPKLYDARIKFLIGCRNVYRRLRHVRPPAPQSKLPGNANLALIRCWTQFTSNGFPMLVLRSPGSLPKAGEFDYIGYLEQLSDRNRLSTKLIEGATHAFAERQSKAEVWKHTKEWLSAYFPLTRSGETRDEERRPLELANATMRTHSNVH